MATISIRRTFVIIPFILLTVSNSFGLDDPLNSQKLKGRISLRLNADKHVFVMGEMFYFDVEIRNLTSQSVSIPEPIPEGELKILVQDSQGKYLTSGIIDERLGPPPQVKLGGKELYIKTINLYSYGNGDGFTGDMRDFLPGKYSVSVGLGDLTSNIFEFSVVTRSPEEAAIHRRLEMARGQYGPWPGLGTAIKECKALIDQYPHTVFLPNLYLILISSLYSQDSFRNADEVILKSMELIAKFPNLGTVSHALSYLARATERKSGVPLGQAPSASQTAQINRRLLEIKKMYPNTRVPRYVDERLRKNRE